MITRVTSQMMTAASLRNLQGGLAGMANLQQKAASQRAFTSPSEDPAAATATMKLHSAIQRNDQYARNVDDGMAWTVTADNAISASHDLLTRARDLTLQGANEGAMDELSREAIAVELESLRDELLTLANTKYLGRSVFAGTTDGQAFTSGTYTHNGIPGGAVERRVADNLTIRVDVDGSEVFGSGASSVFATIDNIVADLRAGVNVGARVGEIDTHRTAMLGVQGRTGVAQAQLERYASSLMADNVELESRRTEVEDVDAAEVLLELNAKNLVYEMSLSVAAKALPKSLMEYI